MREGPHWTGYPLDDPPEPEHWCERCGAECECPYDPEGDESNEGNPQEYGDGSPELSLDKVEATTQWFDEFSARGNNAGGEDVCLPALSPAPLLQLDYPAWRLSFSAYGEHMGWEVPA